MLQRAQSSSDRLAGGTKMQGNDAQYSAERASLSYVSDADPGIRRLRKGNGFAYVGSDGNAVGAATLARVKAIVIPPAWTDVWISPDPDGHIQATGRDQRGRKQYRYHPQWTEERDGVKYSSLVAFAEALPELRSRIDADLRRHGLPQQRVVAAIVWLLDNTMIRVGNSAYARDNKSFGLTTLRDRHVDIKGSRLRFAFKGKSGKEWKLRLVDRRIAKIVRGAQDLPGQNLFQYLDEEGNRRPVRSEDINRYIREASGVEFSSKHFRTWGGTIHAASLFAQTKLPESAPQQKRMINSIVDKVAERLGNTRAVCRKCYIHPLVFEAWSQGKLLDEMAEANKRKRLVPGLDEEETLVLRWLQARGA
ncbi:DNA topoisomerase IB [Mesorhizobium sp.]|uniref:DNA topoisomerase IB n=1 Tax=Mesorhizobium sp. TaxID=1871066 RepID=UPI000FE95263|nr:DNA topoisomerase IB [Mesorhizobium sp.]RWM30792.1 MAG: DNA topoisomerase IB [Mesorhizobium sp.]RWM41902.1 MAG: DNA topoisomerase IB [Mesorhizobium sp.]TIO78491.1 MAG: DNA topoisomerase IB [Mesorhizobium sp.]TIO87860.1 MAG: DNA topoisomerase IB [Mesorhizobium sp.]TJV54029.1 MAG: DNA topoisomerase IB [Mesorhizobium sp.]